MTGLRRCSGGSVHRTSPAAPQPPHGTVQDQLPGPLCPWNEGPLADAGHRARSVWVGSRGLAAAEASLNPPPPPLKPRDTHSEWQGHDPGLGQEAPHQPPEIADMSTGRGARAARHAGDWRPSRSERGLGVTWPRVIFINTGLQRRGFVATPRQQQLADLAECPGAILTSSTTGLLFYGPARPPSPFLKAQCIGCTASCVCGGGWGTLCTLCTHGNGKKCLDGKLI